MGGTGIRVLLADDHPLLVAGYSAALTSLGLVVVGEAHTTEEAIAQFRALRPDVLVLDIRFGGRSTGLDVAKSIKSQFPDARFVFLSQFDADNLITESYRIGGHAFITKDCDATVLATAIEHAIRGETFFLPAISVRLAKLTIEGDHSPRAILSERELEIFRHLARGLTQSEIATEMNLSLKSISLATQQIKEKLNVHRPAELTLVAVKYDLLRE